MFRRRDVGNGEAKGAHAHTDVGRSVNKRPPRFTDLQLIHASPGFGPLEGDQKCDCTLNINWFIYIPIKYIF